VDTGSVCLVRLSARYCNLAGFFTFIRLNRQKGQVENREVGLQRPDSTVENTDSLWSHGFFSKTAAVANANANEVTLKLGFPRTSEVRSRSCFVLANCSKGGHSGRHSCLLQFTNSLCLGMISHVRTHDVRFHTSRRNLVS
jgi:hypothetical protein